jgi:ribosomal protein L37E
MVGSSDRSDTLFCQKCGQKNTENNYKCTACGFVLHARQYAVDNSLAGLIPYKNACALWSYYLGVFSLIPCIAIPLGTAALVLGIKGLKHAGLHPESKGKVHAWTGIILGSLTALANLLVIALILINRH